MNNELSKRIITSIFLFIFAIFCILINKIIFIIALFVIALICVDEWIRINKKYYSKKRYEYFFVKALGLLHLLFFFVPSAWLLRGDSLESIIFFITILFICIFSDIGGYVFGKTIGGKKLIKISPNKTISGSVGSFIFSILPLFLFYFQNYVNVNLDFSLKNILLCLTVSLSCQLGDLIISYFKRLNNVKDTGTILPGHGGLLDRIDGIIFAIPMVYFLKTLQIF